MLSKISVKFKGYVELSLVLFPSFPRVLFGDALAVLASTFSSSARLFGFSFAAEVLLAVALAVVFDYSRIIFLSSSFMA
jgi:F0F1-type ATP synthase membrane subunit a